MFNTAIHNRNRGSTLQDIENKCFTPIRYLFKGKTYTILNGEIVKDTQSFGKKTYSGIALAIAALIPALILGTIARIFNLLSGDYSDDRTIVERFKNRQIELPPTPLNSTLREYHEQEFGPKIESVMNQITDDTTIWQNPQFVQQFSDLMECGYKFMALYFHELSNRCDNNIIMIRDEMIIQPQNRSTPSQDYSHTFFLFSRLYHYARSCSVRLNRAEWAERMGIDKDEEMPLREKTVLEIEDQEPYFNPHKPQYRWRELYNAFCDFVDKNGLRALLKGRGGDTRFSNWSRHDLVEVRSYYSPDSLPT